MKIKCPGCNTIYNIDISKIPVIPEGGITTTCKKCKAKIPIDLESGSETQVLSKKQVVFKKRNAQQIIPCPQCGHINISTDICTGCGKVFSKEEIEKLEIPIGQ
jgi:ribosomal protein L32